MAGATALETALVELARKAHERPALLAPDHLAPVRALAGEGAVDYVLVLAAFHFINRIADLLHVDAEALPDSLRRVEVLRRIGVRMAAMLMKRMDLANRPYDVTFDGAVDAVLPLLELPDAAEARRALSPLASRPKGVEVLEHALAERDRRSSLGRETLARIHGVVEAALPRGRDDVEGLHRRPVDPVEAFAFVGTRYAYRTSASMIAALEEAGYDDLGILDLAIAIADANQWARTHRLLGLEPNLFYLPRPVASGPALDS